MPSLANGLAAERRRKNAKHAKRLEKKLGVKVSPVRGAMKLLLRRTTNRVLRPSPLELRRE